MSEFLSHVSCISVFPVDLVLSKVLSSREALQEHRSPFSEAARLLEFAVKLLRNVAVEEYGY